MDNEASQTRQWISELRDLGYDRDLPTPINLAIQITMAAITSKAVHELIQQLDKAAVASNKDDSEEFDNSEAACHAALMLESLGIEHWVNLFHTFTTKGEDATLAAIRLLHEELPSILENDILEEGRVDKLANIIGKALS
ncbi:hypothetical protein R1sor_018590 [Riccia sorocarpa]|uniref:Uncharacterized protein n=1 Tax=Riccia sorocarpa TaxID=122646 RepID=A0ABD3IA45_9MARC